MSFLLAAFCTCQQGDKELTKDQVSDVEETVKSGNDSVLEVSSTDAQPAAVTPVPGDELRKGEPIQKSSDEDKASDQSTVATASGEKKDEAETTKPKVKAGPEHLTKLEENNFDDRGSSSLEEKKSYTYTLHNDYTATLAGWTHTRPFARGFVRTLEGTAYAVVSGLDPGVPYLWKVYQVAAISIVTNELTVNGESQGTTKATHSEKATASGRTTADPSGKIIFSFSRDSNKVTLSGLAVAREEAKEGKKPKVKAKVKAKAKAKVNAAKSAKRVDAASSSESDNENCPSSKKASDFEKELKKMKKKIKNGESVDQKADMGSAWLYTQMSEPDRKNKRDMFKSFYQEM